MKTYEEAFELVVTKNQHEEMEKRFESVEEFCTQYGTLDDIRSHPPSMEICRRTAVLSYGLMMVIFEQFNSGEFSEEKTLEEMLETLTAALVSQQSIGVAIGMEMEKESSS